MHGSSLFSKLIMRQESWADIRAEIGPVWDRHNEEIAAPGDKGLLSPDWAKFDDMARNGQDHWVTVRHFGRIVGYAFVIVTTHLHRRHTLYGFYDLYWLHPNYRKGRTAGRDLLKFTEASLKARGVQKVCIGTKVWYDISPVLERMGYEPTEKTFTKAL